MKFNGPAQRASASGGGVLRICRAAADTKPRTGETARGTHGLTGLAAFGLLTPMVTFSRAAWEFDRGLLRMARTRARHDHDS